jgi:hypothetical protein
LASDVGLAGAGDNTPANFLVINVLSAPPVDALGFGRFDPGSLPMLADMSLITSFKIRNYRRY